MTDIGQSSPSGPINRLVDRVQNWGLSKIASPDFQRWAASFSLTRGFARRDAAQLYDLVAGFVYSQTLLACTELGVLRAAQHGPILPGELAARNEIAACRMEMLCQAAASVGLLVRQRCGAYRLGRLGAAALGVPGLEAMILHHKTFYRDLSDPVALMRGDSDTELSRFWPYVLGQSDDPDPDVVAAYSELMAASQHLVAEETLDAVSLSGLTGLTDIGGGTGVFLGHVAQRYPSLDLHLFDLPGVINAAQVSDRNPAIVTTAGSFLTDALPEHGDAISLIRVLYDHDDDTVCRLLARVSAVLPPGGRIIVSEPMSGGDAPCRAGDAYFGFYTMAMTTGRPRSPAQHIQLLNAAGFTAARRHPTRRPFLTSVVSARKPSI